MKRHLIAKSAILATLTLLLFGINTAMANIATENTAEAIISRFQAVAIELPEIHADATATPRLLSSRTLEKLLTEKIEFRNETRPLVHALKTKWAALSKELLKQSPEETTTARLESEISTLDARLTEMRLEHLMALKGIKTDAVS